MSYISAATIKDQVWVWERTPLGRVIEKYKAPLYCYVPDPDGKYTAILGEKVSRHDFRSMWDYHSYIKEMKAKAMIGEQPSTYELLIAPELKVLSQHYYNVPAPDLTISFVDIEVDYDPKIGFSSVADPYAPISSLSIRAQHTKEKTRVYFVPPPNLPDFSDADLLPELKDQLDIILCKDETELLTRFCQDINDVDCLVAWNGDFFDFPYIGARLQVVFGKEAGLKMLNFPGAPLPRWSTRLVRGRMTTLLDVNGRIMCDLLALFKKFEQYPRESYALERVAEESLTNFDKLKFDGSLYTLYRQNPNKYIEYNARDTDILEKLEDKYHFTQLANEMYHLSTASFAAVKGTVQLAQYAIVNYAHHQLKMVCKDRYTEGQEDEGQIEGAKVLPPKRGEHWWFAFIDIKSLYPSAIQTLNISPETLIAQCTRNEADYEAIINGVDRSVNVTMMFEGSDDPVTMSVEEWKIWLIENMCAISAYGTVYNQRVLGIIPQVLQDWRQKRIHYQKLKKQASAAGDTEAAANYDRLQYTYKIKLNALYGALNNKFFLFYDKRHGESTTGTGRVIITHQGAFTNEILCQEYRDDGEAIIMGDTDSTCFQTFASNVEDAVEISNAVSAAVNERYPSFLREKFLVQDQFSHGVECEREIVGKRGIFIAKKHYFCHVVDKEGKSVDEWKIMGVITKKTALPRHIGNTINEFVKRYLLGESWASIAPDVVEYRNKLQDAPMTEIGLPSSVNNLDTYTIQYKQNPKDRLPPAVAGAILWNECRQSFGDTESPQITTGTRIKRYRLIDKYYKFNWICIPLDLDLDKLPSWFDYGFQIDRVGQVESLVDDPLKSIMDPVQTFTVPTAHSIALNELVEF